MNQSKPNDWLDKIETEIVERLSGLSSESQLEYLNRFQSVIESRLLEIHKKQLSQFWLTLKDIYPDLCRLEIQLDYVPNLGVSELWSLNPQTLNGEVYQWSVHWFDKPVEEAKVGLWGSEVSALENLHVLKIDTPKMWAWSQRFLSWFQKHLPKLSLQMEALEGISAFSIEDSSAGLKLTAEKI